MNQCITPEFEALVGASKLETLKNHPSTVYGLDAELNISYLNPAWFKFAEQNGDNIFAINDWPLGKDIFDSIPDVLQPFYKELFKSALNEIEPSLVSSQSEYECSSPELYRRFSMHLYSLGNQGLLAVHSLLIEEPYMSSSPDGTITFKENQYIDKNGMVRQCANCRRIQNINNNMRWDWIPKWIKEPVSNISHGVCPPCLQHYYLSNVMFGSQCKRPH